MKRESMRSHGSFAAILAVNARGNSGAMSLALLRVSGFFVSACFDVTCDVPRGAGGMYVSATRPCPS
jgi:hypothetical protein